MDTEPSGLRVHNLIKTFRSSEGQLVRAIDDVSIDVGRGEFLVLLGPSGCGKTTLLRSVGGLEQPDSGRIAINGRVVFDGSAQRMTPPERRDVSMVFQSYALWPHMTVLENVAFPLRYGQKASKQDAATRARRALEIVGIDDLQRRLPSQLSGGQQQRVSLARAIVQANELILFDEPLSNVDAMVREQLRTEMLKMHAELQFTALYVTHDQAEAMMLATRLAVFDRGHLVQLDTPERVYSEPATEYVANFIGTANTLHATVLSVSASGITARSALGVIHASRTRNHHGDAPRPGETVSMISRPEQWRMAIVQCGDSNEFGGSVKTVSFAGAHTEYLVATRDGHEIKILQSQGSRVAPGTDVWLSISHDDLLIF